ncbi:hypothetical protein [Eubacterium sp. AF05-24]|uniref:hypothetical protein n=1 Tax=Eubacterium sp. AF05-24 TaxID=2996995 RepID=UPI0013142AF3|nr:hypothetical protein [Eubacterium sp. AF05-24]
MWQRGTSFNITNNSKFNYCADRWRVYNGFTASKSSNGGITVKGANVLQQVLENKLESGKKYTISARIDGTIRIMTFTAGTTSSDTYFSYDATSNAVGVYLSSSANRSINWVKLELGSLATTFVSKSYVEELTLCERYYQKYSYMMVRNLTSTPGVLYGGFPLRARMRIKPNYYSVLKTSQGTNISSDLADYYLNDNAVNYIQMKTNKLDCMAIETLNLDAEIY